MPELPEVHTTVTGLQKKIVGLTITDLWANAFSVAYVNRNNHKNKAYFEKLRTNILGKKVADVTRRGKHILINLSGGGTIVIHMKMTGHLLYGKYELVDEVSSEWPWLPKEKDTPLSDLFNRHIRAVFTFHDQKSKESHLAFCDSRKFGTIEFFEKGKLDTKLGKLGPEPLDETFTEEIFKKILERKKSGLIKSILLDQTVLVGVGNIYSDEALHLARINPLRDVTTLTEKEKIALYENIKNVLSSGIDFGGDSMSDYRNVDGGRGTFQGKHRVYLRHGKECLQENCMGRVGKKKIGGRSAHFCNTCQK